jgi:hypothetical protein
VTTQSSTTAFDVAGDAVVPVVDGVRLTDLVRDFERRAGYEPSGGYGGVAHVLSRFGPVEGYYLGVATEWLFEGYLEILSWAGCREPGCWPLEVQVTADTSWVTWHSFRQMPAQLGAPMSPTRAFARLRRGFGSCL